MSEVDRIAASLKRVLKQRAITYAELAKRIGLSEVSVKRLFSTRSFTLARLEQVCRALELDFYQLAKLARGEVERLAELSIEQERALAQDAKLLTLFHLLLHDWSAAQVCREFSISEPEVVRLLARLDRLKLIDLGVGNRVRLRVPQHFSWRRNGPVRQRYQASAIKEYLGAEFSRQDELLRLEVRELSPASLAVLKRKLERLAIEFNEFAEVDSHLAIENRTSVGMVLAIRPWVFSMVSALRSKRAAPG